MGTTSREVNPPTWTQFEENDVVVVAKPGLCSSSQGRRPLPVGETGVIARIDESGDLLVSFENIERMQWVVSKNGCFLERVAKARAADESEEGTQLSSSSSTSSAPSERTRMGQGSPVVCESADTPDSKLSHLAGMMSPPTSPGRRPCRERSPAAPPPRDDSGGEDAQALRSTLQDMELTQLSILRTMGALLTELRSKEDKSAEEAGDLEPRGMRNLVQDVRAIKVEVSKLSSGHAGGHASDPGTPRVDMPAILKAIEQSSESTRRAVAEDMASLRQQIRQDSVEAVTEVVERLSSEALVSRAQAAVGSPVLQQIDFEPVLSAIHDARADINETMQSVDDTKLAIELLPKVLKSADKASEAGQLMAVLDHVQSLRTSLQATLERAEDMQQMHSWADELPSLREALHQQGTDLANKIDALQERGAEDTDFQHQLLKTIAGTVAVLADELPGVEPDPGSLLRPSGADVKRMLSELKLAVESIRKLDPDQILRAVSDCGAEISGRLQGLTERVASRTEVHQLTEAVQTSSDEVTGIMSRTLNETLLRAVQETRGKVDELLQSAASVDDVHALGEVLRDGQKRGSSCSAMKVPQEENPQAIASLSPSGRRISSGFSDLSTSATTVDEQLLKAVRDGCAEVARSTDLQPVLQAVREVRDEARQRHVDWQQHHGEAAEGTDSAAARLAKVETALGAVSSPATLDLAPVVEEVKRSRVDLIVLSELVEKSVQANVPKTDLLPVLKAIRDLPKAIEEQNSRFLTWGGEY